VLSVTVSSPPPSVYVPRTRVTYKPSDNLYAPRKKVMPPPSVDDGKDVQELFSKPS